MEIFSLAECELFVLQNGYRITIKHQGEATKVVDENSKNKMKQIITEIKRIEKLYTGGSK